MGFQDVALLPSGASFSTTFHKHCDKGENLGTTTCLKTVVVVSKGILPVKYFCCKQSLFLCQLNFMEIIGLS